MRLLPNFRCCALGAGIKPSLVAVAAVAEDASASLTAASVGMDLELVVCSGGSDFLELGRALACEDEERLLALAT